jgi:hypothetical protein
MASVVVIDRDPLKLGVQVLFHLPHEVAVKPRKSPIFSGVLRGTMKRNWCRSSRARAMKARPSASFSNEE